MMISPAGYITEYQTADYHELMKERDQLIKLIRKFEKAELAGSRSGEEWNINLSPAVKYQCHLEYLSALCNLMQKRYNTEYVWGDKSLSDPAPTAGPKV